MTTPLLRATAPRRWLLLLAVAIGCVSTNATLDRVSLAVDNATAPSPAAVANPICALSIERLVFTLADLSKQSCGDTSGTGDSRCSSLCWCRQWASVPVTSATLAQCVAVSDSAGCVGQDQVDCRSSLAVPLAPATSSNTTNNASQSAERLPSRASPWVYVLVTLLLVGIVAGIVFAVNWYRHRPRSVAAPATVNLSEQGRQGGPLTWTEVDTYDEKLPATLPITIPTRRGSIHSNHRSPGGPLHIDESMISGVSGTSYHDLDGTQLGHLNAAHALTDTELSLSRDATRPHVFSPLSANGSVALTDSQLSADSVDGTFHLDGRSVAQRAFSPLSEGDEPHTHQDSSFISVASTTYLTHNDTFSSQLTVLESDAGSTTSTASSMFRETEF